MRKAWATVLPFLMLLSGCSAFFETNVLKGLSTVSAPTAADYQGPGGLDRLAKDLSSPAVVAALKADPAATASIASYLQTSYLSSPPLTTTINSKQPSSIVSFVSRRHRVSSS